MVKVETIGMLDVAKNNPVLTYEEDVANYSFLTIDDVLYLIANETTGDEAYVQGQTISAGDYLNGFAVEAWEGQKLFIDVEHINVDDASTLEVGNILVAQDDGTLAVADVGSGTYFEITDIGLTLTGTAVKAKVVVE